MGTRHSFDLKQLTSSGKLFVIGFSQFFKGHKILAADIPAFTYHKTSSAEMCLATILRHGIFVQNELL
jgi:hypothetical protein